MISLKRLTGTHSVKITRIASGESMRLICDTAEQREAVEAAVVALFKVEIDTVSVIDEAGNLFKRTSPHDD